MKMHRLKEPLPGEINYSFVDRFTFVHFGIGFIYGYLHFNFIVMLVLAVLWEFLENPLKYYFPMIFPHATKDTFKNSLGDCIAVSFGWGLATYAL